MSVLPLPILLGGDLNCYSMALGFYEAGVAPSVALGRYRLGVTSNSRFVLPVSDPKMAYDAGRIAMIREVANRHPDRRPVLVGCTDEYASFLIRRKEELGEEFLIPSPPPYILPYADKAKFHDLCRSEEIPVPKTCILNGDEEIPAVLPFLYPAVLKPGNSEEYWHHPFSDMRKVYFPQSRAEAEKIRLQIRNAGYCGAILLQERIPISDSDNYVLTVYSDRFGRAVAAAFGRVLLEEHTPKGLGNHAAIITEKAPPIVKKLAQLMERIGYRGFANFDLLRHPGSGEWYVLEMNLRQGRSNHYMTAAGLNPAGLILRDHWEGQELAYEETSADILWHSVPLSVLFSLQKDEALIKRMKRLVDLGRSVSPYHMKAELWGNPLRRFFVMEHERRTRCRFAKLAAGKV